MKRVIITGPTGAVGMALIEYLCSRDVQVIAVVRSGSGRKSRIIESADIAAAECTLAEMSRLPQKVKAVIRQRGWNEEQQIDVFYHFAWEGSFGECRNDLYLQNENVRYALEAVDAAAELGCRTFIGAGSQAEYGRYGGRLSAAVPAFPENGYGMAKLCAGQMTRIRCEQKGIRHIWARILSVYGPYDRDETLIMSVAGKLLNNERVSCTRGEQLWDYLYSKDAAKMMYLLGLYGIGGKTYCLGSGTVRPLKEYMEEIRNIIDTEAEIGFGDIEYPPKQVMYLCADLSELKSDTGFEPDYSFEKGIRETIMWCKRSTADEKNQHIDSVL